MASPRRAGTVPGAGLTAPASGFRPYRHQAGPDELSPREIVAGLHARIAAQSTEHAVLVARHDRARREGRLALPGDDRPDVPKTDRQSRVLAFGKARAGGMSKAEAAEAVGISLSTATTYWTEIRRAAEQEREAS